MQSRTVRPANTVDGVNRVFRDVSEKTGATIEKEEIPMEEKIKELNPNEMQDVNGGASNIEWIDHYMMPSAKPEHKCLRCGFTTTDPEEYYNHIVSCSG